MTSHYFRNILDPNSSIKYRSKIPREIRLEVIRKWLQGKTRDQVDYEVVIGAGTVSGIVRDNRKDDPVFDLLREVALNLKTRGLDIRSFALLIRLREVLDEKGWLLDIAAQSTYITGSYTSHEDYTK